MNLMYAFFYAIYEIALTPGIGILITGIVYAVLGAIVALILIRLTRIPN